MVIHVQSMLYECGDCLTNVEINYVPTLTFKIVQGPTL
jgi:hypothetical protein